MHITYKGDYALKAVLDLASHYGKGVVKIQDLAQRLDIPQKFLEQVLLTLKRGGFVESKRGMNGGYFLARNPKDIKIGQVLRFIDGPIEPIACVVKNYKGCRQIDDCVLRPIWTKVSKTISDIIDKISFEEVRNQTKKQRKNTT